MKKRLWIISEFYYPDENATGHLITEMAERLSIDDEVHVLSGPRMNQSAKIKEYSYVRNGVVVERLRASTYNKNILVLRLINIITLSIQLLFRLLQVLYQGDHILVVTNPPSFPFIVAIVSRLKKTFYSVLLFDVYPDVLIATGLLKDKNPLVGLMNKAASFILIGAEHVIVLGRDVRKLVKDKYKKTENLEIIPLWGDVQHIVPMDKKCNPILKEHSFENNFVVLYVGNIGRTHNVELLVQCAQLLINKSDISFLFIGDGAKKKWLDNRIAELGLCNIKTHTFYSRTRQSDVHSAGDIAVVSFIPGMAGISVPSRMYNIMAGGKPILAIADEKSELAMVVREENIGWVISSYNAQDVVDVILTAKNKETELLEMGARARKVVEEKYTLERIILRYKNLILYDNNR
ncbi:MAG: hypothetical protein C0417_02560 [Chlorobiaceae bacterium]|nr:hypothetical protein [Chlorobiaceae bacterium]